MGAKSCPRCVDGLRVRDVHDVELDACPTCNGLWFDLGELEQYLAAKGRFESDLESPIIAQEALPARSCPACEGAMNAVGKCSDGKFALYRCEAACGVWVEPIGVRVSSAAANASNNAAGFDGSYTAGELATELAIDIPLRIAFELVFDVVLGVLSSLSP